MNTYVNNMNYNSEITIVMKFKLDTILLYMI